METKQFKEDFEKFKKEFSESKFWHKLQQFGRSAGIKVTYSALLLYYLIKDEHVPVTTKAVLIGALGYFIFPIDIIPDVIPILGFADDLAVLLYAITEASKYITEEIQEKAKIKLTDWFGKFDESEVEDIDSKINRN
jgi:uncharacterized membrane protein YkvA (DUF1232 family)